MSITLTYPIRETHDNLALKRIIPLSLSIESPILPSPLRMMRKMETQNYCCANDEKLQKNQHFEISLIPKDYLLEEKMRTFPMLSQMTAVNWEKNCFLQC